MNAHELNLGFEDGQESLTTTTEICGIVRPTRLNNLLYGTIMDPKLQRGWYESKSWKQGAIKITWDDCDFEEDQWEGQRTYQRRFHLSYTNVRPTIRETPSCKLMGKS